MGLKFSNKLTVVDFKEHPIWGFTGKAEPFGVDGELVVEPVRDIPVTTLEGRFVGTSLVLANGTAVFGVLIGINLRKPTPISSIIFYKGNQSFLFRRNAPKVSGPKQLALFLELKVDEVFPISYDISRFAFGALSAVKGQIPLGVPPIPEGISHKDYLKKILQERERSGSE